MVTPTPLSANTHRLMPVLQEANGLYISMALLDSALGSNLSEMQINNGPLLSTIQNFMQFSSRRMKLDSVAEPMDSGGAMGSTTDLLSCQDEKPMMTFGIADYPSLGFKEELAGMGGPTQGTNSCDTLYGSLSKFICLLNSSLKPIVKEEKSSDPEAGACMCHSVVHVHACVVCMYVHACVVYMYSSVWSISSTVVYFSLFLSDFLCICLR